MSDVETPPQASVAGWERDLWCLAAVVLAAEQADPSLTRAAADVLDAAALDTVAVDTAGAPVPEVTENVAALKASLLQAAGLVGGQRFDWLQQSDQALLAQGRASAVGAAAMVGQLLPALGDLTARLAAPGAQLLDVGTGVAALAVAFAQRLPSVTVTGIDVSDRVLELARTTRAASDVADRVQLRLQDIAELTERDHYDLVWLPAPFLPPSALHTGVSAAAAALRPGGWIILGHGKLHGAPLDVALTRLKTLAYGGTALSDSQAQDLLAHAGLDRVATITTPHEAPGITVGHRPEPTGRTTNPPTGSRVDRASHTGDQAERREETPIQTAQAKTLVRRWFTEAMNSGRESTARRLADGIFAVDFVDHDGLGRATRTRAEWLDSVIATVFGSFSDVEVTVEKLFAEQIEQPVVDGAGECLVSVRYIFRGTHTGVFRGIAPTGRRIHHTENEIYRIDGGRIVESWGEGDWLGTLRQLGAPPSAKVSG